MDTIETVSLMLGAAWASGINLYAAILVLGWLGGMGQVDLPPGLEVLSQPAVMLAAGGMFAVEFFADKIPGVDTAWDALHTFIRIPAGAMLAASAAQGLDAGPATELIGLLLGGGIAATSHATKAGARIVLNTSPEPISNWGASLAEDVSVFAGLWAALNHPWVFLALFVVFLVLVAWLLPKIWRAIKRAARALRRWFGGGETAPAGQPTAIRRKALLQALRADPGVESNGGRH
ncbi:MAG: DUF4126 domain-containing protein [Gammaproteobacteria bacterium]|nr:DUF4126 domain-containing protein [Gammaproteobacteria bacterium]